MSMSTSTRPSGQSGYGDRPSKSTHPSRTAQVPMGSPPHGSKTTSSHVAGSGSTGGGGGGGGVPASAPDGGGVPGPIRVGPASGGGRDSSVPRPVERAGVVMPAPSQPSAVTAVVRRSARPQCRLPAGHDIRAVRLAAKCGSPLVPASIVQRSIHRTPACPGAGRARRAPDDRPHPEHLVLRSAEALAPHPSPRSGRGSLAAGGRPCRARGLSVSSERPAHPDVRLSVSCLMAPCQVSASRFERPAFAAFAARCRSTRSKCVVK